MYASAGPPWSATRGMSPFYCRAGCGDNGDAATKLITLADLHNVRATA
jgi:hypothetical protein